MNSVLLLLHVLSAFWFVTGLFARNLTLSRAARSERIDTLQQFLDLSGTFEKKMVIPGSQAVLAFGVILVFSSGYRFAGAGSNWILVSLILFATVALLVPAVFLPKGKQFDRLLVEATKRGEVTPELKAAFADRAVRRAHIWEIGVVVAIIVLMVTKPF